ncbi:hypothetical protein [Streptomyces sp. KS 21]|uniref:hypothetical protein n=1 Tax=Streptomyces sp. KS 21 TaxID=2485150 RepID=UPI0010639438|nr:hypothetical protein [Streptomyces sp. KS 21]
MPDKLPARIRSPLLARSGWLRLHTPLRTGEGRFLTHVEDTADACRRLKDGNAGWYPLAIWPEPGGFLSFANSIDGDYLGWLTEGGEPDTWPLSVWPRHADQGPPLDGGLIDTLLDWQRGTLVHAWVRRPGRGRRTCRVRGLPALGRPRLLVSPRPAIARLPVRPVRWVSRSHRR